MPPRRHKLAPAASSECRARLVEDFAQIGMLGKTRSWLKVMSFSRIVVIAVWQSDANSKEIDKWKI
jgi:hypothetical protein